MATDRRKSRGTKRWNLWQVRVERPSLSTIFLTCKDQMFFTWNGSKETLRAHLQAITTQHPHVYLQILIGSNVRFLNAYIENQNGQLHTRVFHDSLSFTWSAVVRRRMIFSKSESMLNWPSWRVAILCFSLKAMHNTSSFTFMLKQCVTLLIEPFTLPLDDRSSIFSISNVHAAFNCKNSTIRVDWFASNISMSSVHDVSSTNDSISCGPPISVDIQRYRTNNRRLSSLRSIVIRWMRCSHSRNHSVGLSNNVIFFIDFL